MQRRKGNNKNRRGGKKPLGKLVSKAINKLSKRRAAVLNKVTTANNSRRRGRNVPRQIKNLRFGVNRMPKSGGSSKFGTKKKITIEETEYIQEINSNNSSTAFFNAASLPINPGQVGTFPWLSTIAANYQKYRFLKLDFFYQPEATQYAPSGGNVGKVLMAAEYNASLGAPNNKEDMEDIVPNANDMPYENIVLTLDPFELHQNSDAKFIRTAGLPGGSDIKTYDGGNLYVACQGQNLATTALGELHVHYIVEFFDPIIIGQLNAPANNSVTSLYDAAAALTTATPYQPLLAAASSTTVVSTNGCGVVNTSGSIVPPIGNYLLDVDVLFQNAGGNYITVATLVVAKNAHTQNGGIEWAGPALADVMLHQSLYVTCNGTDAITLTLNCTYGTSTVAANTTFRLTAI